jgi:hypothetical protein
MKLLNLYAKDAISVFLSCQFFLNKDIHRWIICFSKRVNKDEPLRIYSYSVQQQGHSVAPVSVNNTILL